MTNKSTTGKTLLVLAPLLSCPVVAQSTNDTDTAIGQLEEIVVTGEKIEKTLFDSTSSVKVFQDPDNGEQRDVYQLAEKTVNVLEAPSGLPHIRGVDGRGPTNGYLTYQTGARSRVATLVDGVTESWSGENFGKAGLWDIEQVEIFRGTQSTMQGRNAIAGTIVANSKDPTYYWEGAFRLGYENNDDKFHAAAMLSGPIITDELAFRLAIDGIEGNTPITYAKPDGQDYPWDPSQVSNRNIRAKLLWEPQGIPGLKNTLTIVDRDSEGQYTNLVSAPYFDYVYDDGSYGTRHQYTDSQTYQLKTEYAFNEALSADVQLSRRDYHTAFEGFPNTSWYVDLDETNYTLESKVDYHPENSPFSGVAGVYVYNRDQEQILDGLLTEDDTKSRAIYFDTNTDISDSVALQFGGRWQNDSQNRHFRDTSLDFVIDTDKTVFLPSIGVTYSPNENLKFGATVRKGYNPGGATNRSSNNEVYTFDEESVWTAELSARAELLDNRLNIGANIFYSEYKDYQGTLSISPAAGSTQSWDDTVILNIPKSYTYGLEASADVLLESWKLGASIGLLHSRIKTAPDDRAELAGNELSFAPAISAGLSVEKFFNNGWTLGADLNYVGHYYDDVSNDTPDAGGYTKLDLHASYDYNDNLTLRAYLNNVTDAEYVYRYKGDFAEVSSPRTFGITVDYRF